MIVWSQKADFKVTFVETLAQSTTGSGTTCSRMRQHFVFAADLNFPNET